MDNLLTSQDKITHTHLLEGALLLVDKPLRWTSFDIVNKIRHAIRHKLGVKKFKVGHAGTLDPLATGLLLICIGKYTKKIESLMGMTKSYEAKIQLGAETMSLDAELLPYRYHPELQFSEDEVHAVVQKFTGHISQVPPMYSALKKDGQALYKLARAGKEVKREPRQITIHDLQCQKSGEDELTCQVTCSKGTYIRTLAADMAKEIGSGGYLSYLRRTQIGAYDVKLAYQVDALVQSIKDIQILSSDESRS